MTTVHAVYENGVFRPAAPVGLADGQPVTLTVTPDPAPASAEEAAYLARLRSVRSYDEFLAAVATAPPPADPDFDIMRAINQTRRETGFRMPDPEPPESEARP